MLNNSKNKGITLIALVISIIVLLILSGISISMLSGDNSILKQAASAKEKTEEATKQEQKDLAELEDVIYESQTGVEVEKVQDTNAGVLEISNTEENTFIINSIEDLVFFAYDVKQGNTYEGKIVKLGLSLDFNSSKSYVDAFRTDYNKYGYNGELKTALITGKGFIPIGTATNIDVNLYSFAGTFDGQGNKIINLYINAEQSETEARIGLFGNNNGIIRNLGILNGNIALTANDMTSDLGSISAKNYNTIEKCYYIGKSNMYSNKNTSGSMRIGGIVSGNGNSSAKIIKCYSSGNINAINNSENTISVVQCGGIACDNSGEIVESFTCGKIEGEKLSNVAGLVAINSGKIYNCYNTKEIDVENCTNIGGISGRNSTRNDNDVNNCYNIGNISVVGEYNKIGSIFAQSTGTQNKNCYYLKDTYAQGIGWIQSGKVANSIEKTENEMKDLEFVVELNNESPNTWKKDTNNINKGYPILNWQ